ncbi:MAG: sulfotransferase [Planctomycetota bacterium]|nr:MAG: sulfotransferase [Planctomycetota bacterium]
MSQHAFRSFVAPGGAGGQGGPVRGAAHRAEGRCGDRSPVGESVPDAARAVSAGWSHSQPQAAGCRPVPGGVGRAVGSDTGLRPIFILGCPRSGTTMLQQALNRHSQIAVPPELKFFSHFYRRSRRGQLRHWKRICTDLELDLAPPTFSVTAPTEARAIWEQIARAYLARVGRPAVRCFGDKTPENTSRIRRIREVFPEARILFLYRDGRDVAVSLSGVPWLRCGIYGGLMVWLYYYRFLREELDRAQPDVLPLCYETIVADPESAFRRILEFLELPYEPAVARGHGNRDGIPVRELAWKARALEPISDRFVGNARRLLGREQVERLNRIAGRALFRLGYLAERPPPPTITDRMLAAAGAARVGLNLPVGFVWSEVRETLSIGRRRWPSV